MTDEPQEIKIENQGADAERAQSIQREHAEIHLQADPGLDPNAPDFDPAAYKAALAAAGGMDAITGQIREKLGASLRAIETTMLNTLPALAQTGKAAAEQAATEELATQEQTLAGLISTTLEVLKGFAEFVNSDTYKAIKESMAAIGGFVKQHRAEIALLAEAAQEVQDLAPFLAIEIEDAKQDPAFADLTLETLVEQGFDAEGKPTDSPFEQIIARAKRRQAEYDSIESAMQFTEQAAADYPVAIKNFEQADLPRIISQATDLLHYPLDKPNSVVWNLLAEANPDGQLAINLRTGKKGGAQDAIVLYGISFDELGTDIKTTRQLTPFDKRVYIAAAALFNGGNEVISATQIYKMMGNSGQPKTEQIQKINDSLTKMGAARVYLDNSQEVKINKKYTRFKYDASLLPFERISAYINNTQTEAAIHLFREPPLITFARERGQITGITRQLLESPISKTDANLLLEDYLLERIGRMKSPKGNAPRKILFATIYEHCHITGKTERDRKERQRTPEKMRKYLDHYKKCGWITGYKMEKDGVTISV